jgi:hypothetical protein
MERGTLAARVHGYGSIVVLRFFSRTGWFVSGLGILPRFGTVGWIEVGVGQRFERFGRSSGSEQRLGVGGTVRFQLACARFEHGSPERRPLQRRVRVRTGFDGLVHGGPVIR